jgi:hypothetical protein
MRAGKLQKLVWSSSAQGKTASEGNEAPRRVSKF